MKCIKILLLCMVIGSAVAQSNPQDTYSGAMRDFAKLDSIMMPAPGMILFTGSSSITKWKDIQDYFPEYRVLNRGFGGSQFSDLIFYARKVIYPYKPKQIFIYEGDNDLSAGKDPKDILAQAKLLRDMIAEHLPNVPVVFISPKPSISRWQLKDKYLLLNEQLKNYAEHTKDTKFADVWTPMIGPDGKPLPIFLEDNLHMKPEGYKIWQAVLKPYLLK